jgi:hypothetical protein
MGKQMKQAPIFFCKEKKKEAEIFAAEGTICAG